MPRCGDESEIKQYIFEWNGSSNGDVRAARITTDPTECPTNEIRLFLAWFVSSGHLCMTKLRISAARRLPIVMMLA